MQAAVAPQNIKTTGAAGPISDAGSDIKSAKPESVTTAGGTEDGAPVMLCDTRVFEIEKDREGAVRALGMVDTPVDDPRFNAITK